MKKIERMFLIALLFSATNAHAATGYTPLVHIPGLSEGGVIDISSYLVGIYIFALSIVGIVAVFYLILGGMKYITAAGNPGKAGDAKSTIEGAIGGLLLAILSWVVINAINPDLLYLRQPGAFLKDIDTQMDKLVDCAQPEHNTGMDCICKDGYEPDNIPTPAKTCNEQCYAEQRCVATHACIAAGSPYDAGDPSYSAVEGCTCADGTRMTLPADKDGNNNANCSDTCKAAKKCGSKFLVVRLSARHGYSGDGYYHLDADQKDDIFDFTLTNDGNYGDFGIPDKEDAGYYPGHPNYNCAILITNEDHTITWLDLDENWIYWVKEGTRITREKSSIYDQIKDVAYDCCNDNGDACNMDWAIWGGECDKESTKRVVMTLFGDDVNNKCEDCNLAEWNGDKPSYRPARDIKCIGGYWQ